MYTNTNKKKKKTQSTSPVVLLFGHKNHARFISPSEQDVSEHFHESISRQFQTNVLRENWIAGKNGQEKKRQCLNVC